LTIHYVLVFTLKKNKLASAGLFQTKQLSLILPMFSSLDTHKGKGYSKLLMKEVLAHQDLQGLRKFLLGTADAHGLYKQFGFKALEKPERMMEITVKGIYL
jgi:GNAT superfamily N-acetyltransferase